MKKIVLLIPTYNEAVSIVELLEQLKEFRKISQDKFDVIVIDDNSPDGTATIVDNLAIDWVSILRRPGKGGLGAAYRAGFKEVLSNGQYTHVITMDADGSHRVADLKKMIAAIEPGKLIVLGTRWIPGGSVVNWPKLRQYLSQAGNA